MRAAFGILFIGLTASGGAFAQDLCSNIRLSVSEQIECRGRFSNSLGDGDRSRIQQEYEDRIRRANDQLILPPALRTQPPPSVAILPSTISPAPSLPPSPRATTGSEATLPATAPPVTNTAPPLSNGIAPDPQPAPDPGAGRLPPPISPVPANPPRAVLPPS